MRRIVGANLNPTMKNNNDSFFAEPVDPKHEARFLALEVICRLFIWSATSNSITIFCAEIARGLADFTFMPTLGSRLQDAASTRSRSALIASARHAFATRGFEGASLDERGVRATVALYCVRPDLINEATLEEIGHKAGRSRQAVHQLADSFRETTGTVS